MKRKQKRFHTADQIRMEIDRYKEKARTYRSAAAAMDIAAEVLAKNGLSESAKYRHAMAELKRKQAERIETDKLVRLKQKLSEWMTPPLPGSGITDRSINA